MSRKQVYRIGVAAIFFAVFITPALYLILGEVTKGKVVEVKFVASGVAGIPSSSYPKIVFEYLDQTYSIQGDENDSFIVGEEIDVIFFKNNPSVARVYSFSSLFLESIIELPIGLLIWWALFKSYPRLFEPEQKEEWFDKLLQRKRVIKKDSKISDLPYAARVIIYFLLAITTFSLLYAIWVLYDQTIKGEISYQVGLGLSVAILLIIYTIFNRVQKG